MNGAKRDCILIFYPHNPFTPRHGSHLRCLQQLDDLRSQYNIVLASSSGTSDSDWSSSAQILAESALKHKIRRIAIFEHSFPGHGHRFCSLVLRGLHKVFGRGSSGRLDSLLHQAFFLAWFNCLAMRHRPRAIIIHYTYWAYLSSCIASGIKVLELHDLLPVNHYLTRVVTNWLNGNSSELTASHSTTIGYIDRVDQLPQSVVTEVKGISKQLNRYDLVWMISHREERLLRELGMSAASQVIYPATMPVLEFTLKTLAPILPIGPNPFNTYALTKFIEDVLPLLDRQLLKNSEIQITGRLWGDRQLVISGPVKYYGVVDDYVNRLSRSAFMIAPTSVGTGQQIKIFEALASATPVIAYRSAVPEDVLAANPSIIACGSPSEFASTINQLLRDGNLLQHYWNLATEAADRQATARSRFPYCRSLNNALSAYSMKNSSRHTS